METQLALQTPRVLAHPMHWRERVGAGVRRRPVARPIVQPPVIYRIDFMNTYAT